MTLERLLWIRPRTPRETLRTTDLVLEAGGFGLVVLDRVAVRLPAIPWARLSLRAERSGSVLLVLGGKREAGTFAAVALGFSRSRACWSGAESAPRLLDRIEERIEILKVRGRGAAGAGAAGAPARIGRWVVRRDAA